MTTTEKRYCRMIVRRAKRSLRGRIYEWPTEDYLSMLDAVHIQCPLNFLKLINFDRFNFAHDMLGILRHVENPSGKLGGLLIYQEG